MGATGPVFSRRSQRTKWSMEESVSEAWPKKGVTFELASRLSVENGNLRETTEERYPDLHLYIYITRARWLTRLGGLAPARPIIRELRTLRDPRSTS